MSLSSRDKKVLLLVAPPLLAAGIAFGAWKLAGATVFVTNGLPIPVEVQVGSTRKVVGAGQWASLGRVFSTRVELVARSGERELEREAVQLTRGEANLYNVLGAAPASVITIEYSSRAPAASAAPAERSLCGTTFQVVDADFLFEEPPRTVSLPKGSSSTTRRWLNLPPRASFGSCLSHLAPTPARAAELAMKLAEALPEGDTLQWVAANYLAQAGEAERALELMRPMLRGSQSPDNHRAYQDLLVRLGRREEAVEEYRVRHEADPFGPLAFLYPRLLRPEQAVELLRAQVEKSPDNLDARRGLAWNLLGSHQEREVLTHTRWYFQSPGREEFDRARVWRELHVRALVKEGRADEAIELLDSALAQQAGFEDALLLQRVQALATRRGKRTGESLALKGASSDAKAAMTAYFKLRLGEPVSLSAQLKQDRVLNVLSLAVGNPEEAVRRAEGLTAETAPSLGGEAGYLLLGEAWRMRGEKAAAALQLADMWGADYAGLRRFVLEGTPLEPLTDLRTEERAGLWLARARVLQGRGDAAGAAEALLELERCDSLHGLARRAAARWPAPGKSAEAPEVLHLQLRDDVVLRPRG